MRRLGRIAAVLALAAACRLPPPGAAPPAATDFELEAAGGRRHRLADWRARGAVVLVFYRGWW
jgi:hypothetical protein